MEPYYYQKMNKPQQAAYHAMQQGVLALADEIQLPRIQAEELYDVFFRLRLDHPEIFWVVSYRYRYYQDSPNIIFVPEYLFEKNKIREHQKAMQSRVEKLARPAAKFTEWEKEKYIHDFICENITYDKLKKPYSHEIIGPLGQGVGVCEGIAKSVKVLCDALGVWCVIAICGNNPEKGIKYRHTWNIVRIGGQYYHLDATFDNTLGKHQGNAEAPGEIRYDYFNLGDKAVFRDHEPLIAPTPGCPDNDHFYYKEKKLSFTKTEEVYKRAQQMGHDVPVAGRLPDQRSLAGTVGTDPQGRRGAAEDRPDQLQLATGGYSFQLCRKCRHPGAGGRHGRRQRRRTVRHRGIKVWDDVRIKNSPTSMRTPGITH